MTSTPHSRGLLRRFVFPVLQAAGWAVGGVLSLWAVGALKYDFPAAPGVAAGIFAIALLAAVILLKGRRNKALAVAGGVAMVMAWWFTLKPSSERAWQPDVTQTAWAEINGDEVTLHNVRNCDYRTETDYTPVWETREVRLSRLTGVDIGIDYWGSPWMAHPIISFQFADAPPVCFSIETRKEKGEKYSAIGGFFRQYELTYIVADERDVMRVRTNYRKGEDLYLYRLNIAPEKARKRFLEYLTTLNELRDKPRWYNAATTNCTTSIRTQHEGSGDRAPWDWRILLNGKGDEMLYERGKLVSDGLPFAELKAKALINAAAKAAGDSPDFSRLIREGRPGFAARVP